MMQIYPNWEHFLQYLEKPEYNPVEDHAELHISDPYLTDEQVKQIKSKMDLEIEATNKEAERIKEAAEYIGVSVEEYNLIMNNKF
jgi:hypothetical protein